MDKNQIAAISLKLLPPGASISLAKLHKGLARNLPGGIQSRIKYYSRFNVEVDTSYPIEREMITGRYDPRVTATMEKLLSVGDVIIDIGANVGALSMVASSLVGETGRILSIEPGPVTHDRFSRTIRSNQIQNITLVQTGLSDVEGELMWNMDPDNLGNASLSASTQGVRVSVTTLDKLLLEHPLSKIDLIKIDVEGMELQVFRGALQTLDRFRPSLIFETMDAWKEAKGSAHFEEMGSLLKSFGYRFFNIDSDTFDEVEIARSGSDTLAIWEENPTHISAISQ